MLAHVYGNFDGPRATIFLHGYPGIRSKQNRDVAEGVAERIRRDSHVLLYSGLSQAPGEFSFRGCLLDVHAYVASLLARGVRELDLVGHSWGGFLALTLFERFGSHLKKVALLSPLLKFPDLSNVTGLQAYFEEMALANPELNLGSVRERVHEFEALGREHGILDLLQRIPKGVEILFLQARLDPITPTATAQALKPSFPAGLQFELVETDHSFLTGRPALIERLTSFLS